jgi:hypothetical protein
VQPVSAAHTHDPVRFLSCLQVVFSNSELIFEDVQISLDYE